MPRDDAGDRQAESTQKAMNQVLKAEHDARLTVSECQEQALSILQDAQEQAQRISKRTDNRISSIHLRCKQHTAKQIGDLERVHAQKRQVHAGYRPDESELTEIANEVAAYLTGARPDLAISDDKG